MSYDFGPNVAFKTITVGTEWVAIRSLLDCDHVGLLNTAGGWFGVGAQPVILSTDPEDTSASKPLMPGMQEGVTVDNSRMVLQGTFRFLKDSVIFYAKTESGEAEVILTCVR